MIKEFRRTGYAGLLVLFPTLVVGSTFPVLLYVGPLELLYIALICVFIGSLSFIIAPKRWGRLPKWPLIGAIGMSATILPFVITKELMGRFDINSILYHLRSGMEGFEFSVLYEFIIMVVPIWLVFVTGLVIYCARGGFGKIVCIGIMVAFAVVNPVTVHFAKQIGYKYEIFQYYEPLDLQAEFQHPTMLSEPEQPLNLVLIYLEGLERTYGEIAAFGGVYDPLTALEKEALTFTNVSQVAGTDWTISGMVAGQCGLPLLSRGVFNANDFYKLDEFLPNSICLSDIFASKGYTQDFFVGGLSAFGGKDNFYSAHGLQNISGLEDFADISPDDREDWGLHDSDLMDLSKARLLELEAEENPYFLIVELNSTHGPWGVLSKPCRTETLGAIVDSVLPAVRCALTLTVDFVEFVKENSNMDNTVIVIMSDHLAHKNNVSRVLKAHERRNTLVMLGGGIVPAEISKLGTMLDVFPTMLDVLGYELEGDHAGLGVSLLSDEPTLVERFSVAHVDNSLFYNNTFSEFIWDGE